MLIFNFYKIGNRLFTIRKRAGLTQWEVAEAANLSNQTYANIERGTVNMKIETILKICDALQITPDVIFTEENQSLSVSQQELFKQLEKCTQEQKETALELLSVYLKSIK